jgi:hypothetical protein
MSLQSNSRDSESTLTPVSPTSRRTRNGSRAIPSDGAPRSDSKLQNPFLDNGENDHDEEAQGLCSLVHIELFHVLCHAFFLPCLFLG